MVAYPSVAPNSDDTRRDLVVAAERLFAARGITGVSLREVNAAAGQRNSSALQYHFGNRQGLLDAVLAKHGPGIDAARHRALDAYERDGVRDLRALAGALVRPSAEKLADVDGGRSYLRIRAEIVNWHELPAKLVDLPEPRDSVYRWRQLVGPLLPEVALRRLHPRFTAIRVSAAELARRAAGAPRRDDLVFTSHLVDLVTALLAAPVSAETTRLLERRAARPAAR